MKQEKKLEEAKRLYKDANADQRYVLESLFPELAEIEDVRIKKEIIAYIKTGTYHKDWVSWLEKQGKQKPYGQKEECLDCQFNYAGECKGSCELKRNEQNPAWGEEDETRLTNIIIMLKEGASLHFNKKDITKAVDWLKSFRPQNRWKPSDEQMKALAYAVFDTQSYSYHKNLSSLEQQLKKLKG